MTARRILMALLLAGGIMIAQRGVRPNRWAQYEHEMQDPIDDRRTLGNRRSSPSRVCDFVRRAMGTSGASRDGAPIPTSRSGCS